MTVSLLLAGVLHFATPTDTTRLTANLESVTVYQAGAVLEHKMNAPIKKGDQTIVITGLSNELEEASVKLSLPKSVSIKSVRFLKETLKEASPNPLQLKKIEDSLAYTAIMSRVIREQLDILKENKPLSGQQVTTAELNLWMNLHRSKLLDLELELAYWKARGTYWSDKKTTLLEEAKEGEGAIKKGLGKLIFSIDANEATTQQLTLSYFTKLASWVPSYEVKANGTDSALLMHYQARLFQSSGFDWKNVKLSISTAMGLSFNQAPTPHPWMLSYYKPKQDITGALSGRVAGVAISSGYALPGNSTEVKLRGIGSFNSSNPPLYVVDGVVVSSIDHLNPNQVVKVDVLKENAASSIYGSRAANGAVLITTAGSKLVNGVWEQSAVAAVFHLNGNSTVLSDQDEQQFKLEELSLPVNYKYTAVPYESLETYLVASVTDFNSYNLLPGLASLVYDGTYMGKTPLNNFIVNDSLNLSLGVDPTIVIEKKMIKEYSSTSFIGNSKKRTITYEYQIKNNKSKTIQLELNDRIPVSVIDEIQVEAIQVSNADYDKESGLLKWNLSLAAGTSVTVRISYMVKHPKNQQVAL
ncbi:MULTISPECIES: DUF4139 domain-containing protein [unclassified Paraflavitalea]|uniref:DUF4139 domain-containing protein n=1 Tax=unclassified Paraflavitalea TaxID=2798305 RepID=UPI003D3442C8